MSVTDPLADMFAAIRNAGTAKKEKVELPSSKLKLQILRVLKEEGYIKNYKHIADNRQGLINIYLKFKKDQNPTITQIKRISKPGLRVYATKDNIPRVLQGMGIAILSTSSGVVTDKRARSQGLGGEVLCYVW